MKILSILSAAALCLTLASCGIFSSKPKEKGTPVTLADKAAGDALRTEENKGKRFAMTGYLHYKPLFTVYVNRPQAVYVQNTPDGPTVLVVDMPWGQGANNVFMPEGASSDKENVMVYDNDKKPHKLSEKLTVSFEYDPAEVWFQKATYRPGTLKLFLNSIIEKSQKSLSDYGPGEQAGKELMRLFMEQQSKESPPQRYDGIVHGRSVIRSPGMVTSITT